MGLKAFGNHAFRRSFNSNVLIRNGIPETTRAKLLGHSVETNLRHYSYENREYLDEVRKILDNQAGNQFLDAGNQLKVFKFDNRKALQQAN